MLNYKKIVDKIYKYRYIIALIIFIFSIVFELSGSSIGLWSQVTGLDDGVIFGESRSIRSDEWGATTTFIFSQEYNNYKENTSLIRGGDTDTYLVYGVPVFNIMMIFKPFLIGFLFLGSAKGYSFYWCGRLIVLCLCTFDLLMIISKKNKTLSLIGTFMIVCSSMVQWWFNVSDMIIYGEIALILLYKYLNTENFKKRLIYLVGMFICAGSYVMTLYPAWQVCLGYMFLAIAIAFIIENRKRIKVSKKDIISIIITFVIFVISIIGILLSSKNVLDSMTNTVYPGERTELGGNAISSMTSYSLSPILPFRDIMNSEPNINSSEVSRMFSLFPMGLILLLVVLFKQNKKDIMLICLGIFYIFIGIWCYIGFPEILAKLTLMSTSPSTRSMLALGFVEILILIRCLSINTYVIKKRWAIVIAVILAYVVGYSTKMNFNNYITWHKFIYIYIMLLYLFYFILRFNTKIGKIFCTIGIIIVMSIVGLTVNPVRTGIDVIYESELIKSIQEVNNEEQGTWMVEDLGYPIPNFVLMAGVPVVNSTHVYPKLELWNELDGGKHIDIYNRFAHITTKIVESDEDIEAKFKLTLQDSFTVYLTNNDLNTLNVKYIFTINELDKFNSDTIKYVKLKDIQNYYIYKVEYVK